LLYEQSLVQTALSLKGRSYFLVGTGDPTYRSDALRTLQKKKGVDVLIVKDANHSLEIPNNALRSIEIVEECMQGITHFLNEI